MERVTTWSFLNFGMKACFTNRALWTGRLACSDRIRNAITDGYAKTLVVTVFPVLGLATMTAVRDELATGAGKKLNV
jgi:hypothetical protein